MFSGQCELVHPQEFFFFFGLIDRNLPFLLGKYDISLRIWSVSFRQLTENIFSSPFIYLMSLEDLTFSNDHFQISLSLEHSWTIQKRKCGNNHSLVAKMVAHFPNSSSINISSRPVVRWSYKLTWVGQRKNRAALMLHLL